MGLEFLIMRRVVAERGYCHLSAIRTQQGQSAGLLCDSAGTAYRIPNRKRTSPQYPLARFASLAFEQPAEKAFRRLWIPSVLDEKINDIAVLVSGTPEIVPFPVNGDVDLVDVPGIA